MGIKTKVLLGTEYVDGEEMNFKPIKEDWNIYEIEDGTQINFKAVVTKIIKTEKKHPMTNDPIYSILTTSVADAKVPESQKAKS